jgi:tRNA (guanine10-N2)-methyltransferase
LKSRYYLGPTSTDHELAFMMANQAELKEGDIVFDPFVGTGSILIACSVIGCSCFGADIDLRVLQGYSVGRKVKKSLPGTEEIKRDDVFANFKFYGLPKPWIVAMDISYPTLKISKTKLKFDAIVWDPPYGVKAGPKKTKAKDKASVKEHRWNKEDESTLGIFTKKENYETNKIYYTLLNLASKILKTGGRLVFLFHTDVTYTEEMNKFPEHPCFKLVHSCENPLMTKRSRHSIKMVKIWEPEELEKK